MYIIKNAVKNIYRYKNKYIMFGILWFVLILTASVCVNIIVRMNKITDNILREYAGVSVMASFSSEMFAFADRMTKNEYLKVKNIKEISDIRFLRYNFNTDFIEEDTPELITTSGGRLVEGWVFVLGYNMSLLHLVPDDFDLDSGRMFENGSECVISKNIKAADEASESWNKTELGDTVIIKNANGIFKEFTVVGIQKQIEEDFPETNRKVVYTTLEGAEYFEKIALVKNANSFSYKFNNILPNEINKTLQSNDELHYSGFSIKNGARMGYIPLLYLDKPEMFLNIENQLFDLESNGISISLFPLFADYRPLIRLTLNLDRSSKSFTVIITFLIICVAVIATTIIINSRKYEIAVMRSIGMTKRRILFNYLIENLAFIWSITFAVLIIAQFIGPFYTKNVFESMSSMVSPDVYKNLTKGTNIELLLQNILIVFGGMTVTVIFSLVLTSVNILRFEPLKIFNRQY